MSDSDHVIDEHTLAAFIAGTLPKSRRDEVITYLAGHPDARELLQMAYDALEAAHDVDRGLDVRPTQPGLHAGTAERRAGRAATRDGRHRGAGRYVAATVIVFVIGVVLRLTLGPPTDALRSPFLRASDHLQVVIDVAEGPSFTWSAVENAYVYRIVVWDPASARVVGRYETRDAGVRAGHPAVPDLQTKLQQGRTYTLRIDALDAKNRLIRSSESVQFEAP